MVLQGGCVMAIRGRLKVANGNRRECHELLLPCKKAWGQGSLHGHSVVTVKSWDLAITSSLKIATVATSTPPSAEAPMYHRYW